MTSDEAVRNWLEHHIGPLSSFERQPRWRPAWFADVERDGAIVPLYVRGDREGLEFSLYTHREADILEALENHGIPVPHIYGRIQAPQAIVFLGSTPIGGPIVGYISQHLGSRYGIGIGAVAALGAGFVGLLTVRRTSTEHADTVPVEVPATVS